ncbi:IclR family transcriptional regulator [Hydrogenophaga sp.]|jgi:IclR family KDG regulon transcriptional repressor|uniref:IclR family transcriptional regulator n=1 Tax=Hydrogenophaga sp. TaxID=1904254 RepID=UPI003F6E5B8F
MSKPSAEIDDDARGSAPRSPVRVMQILYTLAQHPEGVALGTLSQQLKMPKTTLFNLLRSLEGGGYVASEGGRHRVGIEAMKLGAALQHSQSFPENLRPVCARLGTVTGETVMIGTLSDDATEVHFSMVMEAQNPLRFNVRAGQRWPLYASAQGHVLLAFMPAERQKAYLASVNMTRLTATTITTRKALSSVLQKTRTDALAINVNGMIDGVMGISAPIFDRSGSVVAALAVTAPTARLQSKQAVIEPATKSAAEEMSRVLGYGGVYPPAKTV